MRPDAHLTPVGELQRVVLLLHQVGDVHHLDGLHGALGEEQGDDVLGAFLDDLVVVVPVPLREQGEHGGVLLGAPGGIDRLGLCQQLHHRLHEVGGEMGPVIHLGRGERVVQGSFFFNLSSLTLAKSQDLYRVFSLTFPLNLAKSQSLNKIPDKFMGGGVS